MKLTDSTHVYKRYLLAPGIPIFKAYQETFILFNLENICELFKCCVYISKAPNKYFFPFPSFCYSQKDFFSMQLGKYLWFEFKGTDSKILSEKFDEIFVHFRSSAEVFEEILYKKIENGDGCSSEISLKNRKGLHARASVKIVEIIEKFEANCFIEHNGVFANARDIMQLILIAAGQFSTIRIITTGSNSETLLECVIAAIRENFGENE